MEGKNNDVDLLYEVALFRLEKTENLRVSGINPASRTRIGQNDDLMISMRDNGFLPMYPILLSKDGMVGDGHRRLECAKALGIPEVPVIDTGYTVEELMGFNAGSKGFTGSQWTSVMVRGVEPSYSVKKLRDKLINMAGEKALFYLAERGVSPRIVETLTRLVVYLDEFTTPQDNFEILRWMVDNNQQHFVKEAMRDNVDPKVIKRAISEGKSLRRGSWIIG